MSITTTVWNGNPSFFQGPQATSPNPYVPNPGQYVSTQVTAWPTLNNPYVPTGTSNTGTSGVFGNSLTNTYSTGSSYYTGTGTAYTSGISFPPVQAETIVEKLPPVKTIRSIDEPFQPSCEQI